MQYTPTHLIITTDNLLDQIHRGRVLSIWIEQLRPFWRVQVEVIQPRIGATTHLLHHQGNANFNSEEDAVNALIGALGDLSNREFRTSTHYKTGRLTACRMGHSGKPSGPCVSDWSEFARAANRCPRCWVNAHATGAIPKL